MTLHRGYAGHGSHLPGRICFECDRLSSETLTMNAQNAIDALPDDSDPRNDPRLNDPAFVATDEGQALVEAAAKADAQARKDAKAAEAKEKREAAAAKAKADEEARKPGPVEIVKPATNGKATKAARGTGAKAAKPKSGTTAKPAASKPATTAKKPHTPSNATLALGTKAVDVGGTQQYPILGKDGKPLANYQEHNWVWTCAQCSRRLRLAFCTGPKDGSAQHKKVAAPVGYMRESRIVK